MVEINDLKRIRKVFSEQIPDPFGPSPMTTFFSTGTNLWTWYTSCGPDKARIGLLERAARNQFQLRDMGIIFLGSKG